jgi:pimeloyl-ACP methyl ester carboxylesterase
MISEESFAPIGADLTLCFQTFGNPADEPLLLVMGLGGPMIWWDAAMCEQLAHQGFFVVRFDNRDAGLSSKMPEAVARTELIRGFLGAPVATPYTLVDMADDGFRLLDHLGITSAHVVGMSMGGMIAQTMAIRAPERVRSLSSVMSTTGQRTVGWQHPSIAPTLLRPRAPGRDAYIEAASWLWSKIGSPAFPIEEELIRERAGLTFDRGFEPSGVLRQMLAIVTQPDRTAALRQLEIPSLVIHGKADRMVHVSGGKATAQALPNAELMLIDGMGHDLPPVLFDTFVAAIRRTADRPVHRETNSGQPLG